MIEETSRYHSTLETKNDNELEQVKDNVQKAEGVLEQSLEESVNRFFMELLVCFLIICSFLFITQEAHHQEIMQTIQSILRNTIHYAPVHTFLVHLEQTIEQIL